MTSVAAVFDGMIWVWAVWAVGVAVLARGLFAGVGRFRRPSLATVARDEQGVSYSLSYVLVVPFYLCFLCLVYNASLLLLAKIGTLYAAHAGARSAAVWVSAKPAGLRNERIQQSVFTAMAPFVSARTRDLATAGALPPAAAYSQAAEFVIAHEFYVTGSRDYPNPRANRPYTRGVAPADYLFRKYLNAAARTTFAVSGEPTRPGDPCTVTVTHRSPIYVPGVNRFLGSGWPARYEIRSAATIPNETPASPDRTLGIDYRSR